MSKFTEILFVTKFYCDLEDRSFLFTTFPRSLKTYCMIFAYVLLNFELNNRSSKNPNISNKIQWNCKERKTKSSTASFEGCKEKISIFKVTNVLRRFFENESTVTFSTVALCKNFFGKNKHGTVKATVLRFKLEIKRILVRFLCFYKVTTVWGIDNFSSSVSSI